jgi:Fe-S cluster biogenesis protein NfuA
MRQREELFFLEKAGIFKTVSRDRPVLGRVLGIEECIMLEEQVKSALDNVRPSLQADGGDVEFVSVADDGTVSVKLTGACGGCPMAQMTLKMGIENYLKKEIPQVTAVVGV